MATSLHPESRRMYSWWWGHHISPKNSKWLQENLTGQKVFGWDQVSASSFKTRFGQIKEIESYILQYKIDLEGLNGDLSNKTMDLLHQACEKWGFFKVSNHGIGVELMEKVKRLVNMHYEEYMKESFYGSDIVKGLQSKEAIREKKIGKAASSSASTSPLISTSSPISRKTREFYTLPQICIAKLWRTSSNVVDPFFVAKRSKGTEKVSIQACLAESLKVNTEELKQHSVESNVIVHQPVHMTQELKTLRRRVSNAINRQVKAHKFDRANGISSQENVSVVHNSAVHAPFNNRQRLSPSTYSRCEAPKDRHSIARQQQMLRTCEQRKQRYAAKFQWMANVQMRQMYEAHQWWLWHVMNVHNITEQQWSLYMSYLEKEQSWGDSQQRRAQKIEERASKKVHTQFTSIEPMEQSRFEEKPHGPDVSTGAAEDPGMTSLGGGSGMGGDGGSSSGVSRAMVKDMS
ncbi:hypothetical protein IFM89_006573 [Coptis chinensis]|uniref:Non-haem dioxygenase N-terminal domain-containing protein n=1 Tax=Coptis chinensis TaxID=261450 RepID=A0A835IKD2_9MAGN|nr:hypothetical protein IFM89_006573 [Coptis chinensis]